MISRTAKTSSQLPPLTACVCTRFRVRGHRATPRRLTERVSTACRPSDRRLIRGQYANVRVERFEPVTMGAHPRGHGCRDLLVYCRSGLPSWCDPDWLSDETRVRSLCPRVVCTRCGMIVGDSPRTGDRTSTGGTSRGRPEPAGALRSD
jgi:hypothetical protein